MKWLEKYLTQIPMYTVVGGGLSLLIASAAILAALDILAFTMLAVVASTGVFTGVSVLVSYGLGKLYGASSHLQSAAITGLILALIFTPTVDLSVLLHYAFITVIAQVSKYVITYKRRHIFNPAAFAALIGGAVLQLQFASWWVSTPVLFVPLVVTAFFVLYKTRLLYLGGLFVGLGLAIVIISGLLRGEDLARVVTTAVYSWPFIFAAGYMLSEPLTLPPRKWQKLLVGVVVALIMALPFHVGGFYSSPEFALIIGNILAFTLAFRQRADLGLTFKERRIITPTTDELIFTIDRPAVFEPGQYIELTLPHKKQDLRGTRRSFSLTSAPGEKEVKLGVKYYEPSSSFKKQLRTLKPDTRVQATGVTGDFVLPKNPTEKLLLIAGGIGVTPFISHVAASIGEGRDITLLYFVSAPEEAAYRDALDDSNVNVKYFVAKGSDNQFLEGPYITKEIVDTHVTDLANRHTYISGPPAMVSATKKLLRGRVKRIHTDYFSGY